MLKNLKKIVNVFDTEDQTKIEYLGVNSELTLSTVELGEYEIEESDLYDNKNLIEKSIEQNIINILITLSEKNDDKSFISNITDKDFNMLLLDKINEKLSLIESKIHSKEDGHFYIILPKNLKLSLLKRKYTIEYFYSDFIDNRVIIGFKNNIKRILMGKTKINEIDVNYINNKCLSILSSEKFLSDIKNIKYAIIGLDRYNDRIDCVNFN